jgi:hypothetical protein
MRTYEQIYNEANAAGIVAEFERYNTIIGDYLAQGLNTNAVNLELSSSQVALLSKLQFEITGIRTGSCSGCMQDVIKNMNRWLMKNKPTKTKRK